MAARNRAATAFNVVVLIIGAIALAIVVDHLGWSGIHQAFIGTGAWFLVIAAIDLVSAMWDAFAVHAFLRPQADVSYARVFFAQISGMAINRLTPGHTLGEPVKVTTLLRWAPLDAAVSSVVNYNLITLYVGTAAIALGVPLTGLLLDVPHHVAVLVWIGTAVLVVLALALAIVVRRGAIGTVIGAVVAVHLISQRRGERWYVKLSEIDRRLRGARGLGRATAGVFVSRCFNWLGTIVVLHAASIPLTAPLVIATLSVGILITWMSNVIPLGLGIADGSNYVLYDLLGASSGAGLLFTMINRVRVIAFAIIGLVAMTLDHVARRFLRGRPSIVNR